MRSPGLKSVICMASLMLAAVLAGCGASTGTSAAGSGPPRFDHIVVVVEENHSFGQIDGSSDAPYLNSLAHSGALFTDSHAVEHPSEPNYLALFAGSTFGLTSDACPRTFSGPNLGSALIAAKLSFTGYSESLPSVGFTGCAAGGILDPSYARKHNPWVNISDVPATSNQPFSNFPSDFTKLPTVAFVVPDQQHDMHSGSVTSGDTWLQSNIGSYAQWALTHKSLLIVTFDEDDNGSSNQIWTLLYGANVNPGRYSTAITHYSVLRTIEADYGLPFSGNASIATTITGIWK
jgi:hypothetical protein